MERLVPLTVAQRRQWELMRDNGHGFGWLATSVRLDERVPAPAVARGIHRLFEMHEALRARVLDDDGEPRQVVLDLDVDMIESRTVELDSDAELDDAQLAGIARRAASSVLDNSCCLVISQQRQGTVVCLTVHHLFADAAALSILADDLRELLSVDNVDIKSPAAQLSDIPTPRLRAIEGPALSDWQDRLGEAAGGSPFSFLPNYQELPHSGSQAVLTPDLTSRLVSSCRRARMSLPGALNAALGLLLQAYEPASAPIIQTVVANRGSRAEAAVVANLSNSSYIIPRSGAANVADRLSAFWQGHLEAVHHGWFDRIALDHELRKASTPNRYVGDISAISNIGLPPTATNLPSDRQVDGYQITRVDRLQPPVDACRSSNTHLHVFADFAGEGLTLRVYTSSALSGHRDPEAVCADLMRCVEAIIAGRDLPLSGLRVDRLT